MKELAEVYTNNEEVESMLNLVKESSYEIESKFFEPSCGNGNFLVKIFERKLETINKLNLSRYVYEYKVCVAVSNIYAVDICAENVKESIERMLRIIFKNKNSSKFYRAVEYILEKNIQIGDTLEDEKKIILIDFIQNGCSFIQKRYFFEELFNENPKCIEEEQESIEYFNLGEEK